MKSKVRLAILVLSLLAVSLFTFSTQPASACARCGDGVCARSCENEFSCPKDCAPQPSLR